MPQLHTLNQAIAEPFPTDTVLLTRHIYWLWGGAARGRLTSCAVLARGCNEVEAHLYQ
jgi:hypothetical protein